MPQPQSPVITGLGKYETVFGKHQPEYAPLPALKSPDGRVMSRWAFTDEERAQIANGADVLVTIHTFGRPYPPTEVKVESVFGDPAFYACKLCIDDFFLARRSSAEQPEDGCKEA